MPEQFVWNIEEANPDDLGLFGGKGAGLARMIRLGLPVPPAFIISTDAFRAYRQGGKRLPAGLGNQVDRALAELDRSTGRHFDGDGMPLLVSVRSGAKVSMPGMMDTILNLGLDAESLPVLASATGSTEFAIDTWVRFWCMYADTVMGIDEESWIDSIAHARAEAESGTQQSVNALQAAIQAALREESGETPPAAPRAQLDLAIAAVFDSWDSPRAQAYRKHHDIPDDLGTAVVVQAMVFGNLDQRSGSGVAFTRDPATGEQRLFGEYLIGRQGEELVAGTATPVSLAAPGADAQALTRQLTQIGHTLETVYRDALDIEFTVESDKLYLLQVRPAKRTAAAAVRIAQELANAGIVTKDEALKRVSTAQVKQLLRSEFDAVALAQARQGSAFLARGTGASPGHASGVAVLDSERAVERAATGAPVILLRPTTSPLDIRGMLRAQGILTSRGGSASHAAVVARALDKPCVVGCAEIAIDPNARSFSTGTRSFGEGDLISIDGASGEVFACAIPMRNAEKRPPALASLLDWADQASGARLWLPARSQIHAKEIAARRPHGIGVVAMTDLLIAAGALDGLLDAITALSANPGAANTAVEARFEDAACNACRSLFDAARGAPIDIRLPHLSSARARRLVAGWASLAPQMLLPLGAPRLIDAYLRAISRAVHESGHDNVTVVIAGITDAAELHAFRAAVSRFAGLRAGAVLQNPVALGDAEGLLVDAAALWIDLPELTRTTHGYPEELLYSDEVLDEYVSSGRKAHHPSASLDRLSKRLLTDLVGTAQQHGSARVGVDLGGAPRLDLIAELYRTGFRHFTCPPDQLESVRLHLGQVASAKEAS